MYCGACGQNNPSINRFCVECGSRLHGDDPSIPLVDGTAARLLGLTSLPAPTIEWPDDLPREVKGKDGARLLLVPGGFFWMGAKKQKKDERPYRLVYIDSYYIDERPVTVDLFRRFLADGGRKAPRHLRELPGELPAHGVSWHDAQAYATWALRRLPTEAEWEKAARGVDGRLYPWGDASPEGRANLGEGPTPVDAFPDGRSPYGALDMAGNVWEWCEDLYDQDFYPRSSPRNPRCDDGDPRYRVLRGGSFGYSAFTARCAYRGWNLPAMAAECYGFRCAVEAARFRRG